MSRVRIASPAINANLAEVRTYYLPAVSSAARVFRSQNGIYRFGRYSPGIRTMPRLTTNLPRYRKHRASGQAIVTIDSLPEVPSWVTANIEPAAKPL